MSGIRDIFETKNKISDVRNKFYTNPVAGAENPTYLKESGDQVVFGVALGGGIFGFLCILNGLFNMSLGINKVKK